MSPRSPLRAVGKDETAPPKSITDAAARGTHRDLLVAMRDRIAKTVEDPKCPPRDLASLSRRLMELAKEIEAIDLAEKQEAQRASSRGPAGSDAFDASAI